MALTVEDGSGVASADAYASKSFVDAYWNSRTHSTRSATWSSVDYTDAQKEGAIREATAYLDAVYANRYRGYRRGNLQGLEWPRTNAQDDSGWPLRDLPTQLLDAVAELAVRALGESLAADQDPGGSIKRTREKVGPIEREIEYAEGQTEYKRFGTVDGILAPILKHRLSWTWA